MSHHQNEKKKVVEEAKKKYEKIMNIFIKIYKI